MLCFERKRVSTGRVINDQFLIGSAAPQTVRDPLFSFSACVDAFNLHSVKLAFCSLPWYIFIK